MADKPDTGVDSKALRAVGAMLIVIVLGLTVSLVLHNPSRRKHPERQQVRMWHMWQGEWAKVVQRIVDRYNASQSTYEVVALSVPSQAGNSKFLLAVAGGDPPDCMAQWNNVIPRWAESKLLVPLNSMMTDEEWARFQKTSYPIAKRIGIYKGNLYGVTTGLNIFACYYRTDFLAEAGLDPADFPKTLEGLVEWGRKLHKFGDKGELTRIGFMPQYLRTYAPGFGGGFWDWRNPSDIMLDTPENLRAMAYLVKCRQELDDEKESGCEKVLRLESGFQQGFADDWAFMHDLYAILVDGQWRVTQLAKHAPEVRYGTIAVPPPAGSKHKNYGFSNGNFMIIPAGAKCPKGAWDFIKFWSGLSDPERAAEFYTWGGWLPLNDSIANAKIYRKYVKDHPQFQTFIDILPSEHIHPMAPVPYQDYLADRIQQADDSAMRGTLTPAGALQRLAREIATERKRRRETGRGE